MKFWPCRGASITHALHSAQFLAKSLGVLALLMPLGLTARRIKE
jgi:hypothetical protein